MKMIRWCGGLKNIVGHGTMSNGREIIVTDELANEFRERGLATIVTPKVKTKKGVK